jgi:hypothetical protein
VVAATTGKTDTRERKKEKKVMSRQENYTMKQYKTHRIDFKYHFRTYFYIDNGYREDDV